MTHPTPSTDSQPVAASPVVPVRPMFRPIWLLEAAVGLAVAYALSRWAGMRIGGFELMVIPVVLTGAMFGFWIGALAGLAAAVAVLVEHGAGLATFLTLSGDRAVVPTAVAIWAMGALTGFIGDAHRMSRMRAEARASDLAERLDKLHAQHQVIVAAKEALDRRVVTQVQTVSGMYEAAQTLEVLDADAILPATARLVARFLEAEAVSIYTLDGFRLSLAAAHGDAPRHEVLTVDEGPIGQAVRLGAVVGVRSKEEFARSQVLLAAPLKRADGAVRAAIAVERLPFANLTPATTQMLELIADWAGRALANSEAYREAQSAQVAHPVTGIHRSKPLLERMAQEWAIARRYELPLSLVMVRKPSLLQLPAERRAQAALPLVTSLKQLVRDVDLVGHYRTDDSFLLVLPLTDAVGAAVLVGRIEARMPDLLVFPISNSSEFNTPEAALQYLQVMAFDMQEV